MDDEADVVVLLEIPFDVVDDVVALHHVVFRRHLHMYAGKTAAGAVIVHHQVVGAQHAVVAHHLFADVIRQLLAGRLSQQRIDRFLQDAHAAPQNEQRHAKAHPAVQLQPRQARDHARRQHRRRGDHVVAAVHGRGFQRGRADAPAHLFIKGRHPQLHADGEQQHRHGDKAELHGRGGQDLADAGTRQLHADDEDHHRDGQPRQIFDARMAVRVFVVRGLCRKPEAHQRDDAGRGVGKVVHRVGRNGDAAEQRAHRQLGRTQQHVAENAHRARQIAVSGAHPRVVHVRAVFDKAFYQKVRQSRRLFSRIIQISDSFYYTAKEAKVQPVCSG